MRELLCLRVESDSPRVGGSATHNKWTIGPIGGPRVTTRRPCGKRADKYEALTPCNDADVLR
jgi:hypothetical protein